MKHSLTCTFCRKSEHQVQKLVAGPGVYICDACIDIAHGIIHDTPRPPRVAWWRSAAARLRHIVMSALRRGGAGPWGAARCH